MPSTGPAAGQRCEPLGPLAGIPIGIGCQNRMTRLRSCCALQWRNRLHAASDKLPGDFEADLATFLGALRATQPVDPAQPAMVAGDPQWQLAEARLRDGIPVGTGLMSDSPGGRGDLAARLTRPLPLGAPLDVASARMTDLPTSRSFDRDRAEGRNLSPNAIGWSADVGR